MKKSIALTATKTIEEFLDTETPSGRFLLDLADLKESAQRANKIAKQMGITASDPRTIRVTTNPYRLPNSSKWAGRLRAAWAVLVRENGRWHLTDFGYDAIKSASGGKYATDHIYIEALDDDDEKSLLRNRRKQKIGPQSTHVIRTKKD